MNKNEWVRVKYHDIIAKTDKATLFLFSESEVWLPNKLFRFSQFNNVYMPLFLAQERKLDYCFKPLKHVPEKIEPKYNQEAIDELRFNPK